MNAYRSAPLVLALLTACTGSIGSDASTRADAAADTPARDDATSSDVYAPDATTPTDAPARDDAAAPDAAPDVSAPDASAPGPMVDRASPQLHSFMFTARDADPEAAVALGTQTAFLDTRAAPRGLLVVYLHGAGRPSTCGSNAHEQLLASWGFHVLGPCYVSDYGVGNCGADIGGCRLEAFDGEDHHSFVNIPPPDAIERRVVRALRYLQTRHAGGDWAYYLDGDSPRWSRIVISGISHGASTTGLIAQVRSVERAVMLSGPLDTGQAWLRRASVTPAERLWGFSHTMDAQHAGHLQAFTDMGLPGMPTSVDGARSPYGGTHRLITSGMTSDGHTSTQAGGTSPRDAGGQYVFAPAWRRMYGAE